MNTYRVRYIREFELEIEAVSTSAADVIARARLSGLPDKTWRLLSVLRVEPPKVA